MKSLIVLALFLFSQNSWSYPDFISYGYNTCISCHYNSHGNGPLTDYGRALFSQEIAARNFWTSKKTDDETIAEKYSGFIPGVQLPFWIRPNLKYRGLYLETNPGSAGQMKRSIRMQRDINLVFSPDDTYRTILVLNYGLLHEKDMNYYGNGTRVDAVSREHYVRFFPIKKLLVAAGLMDIVYGIRHADHTSVTRDSLGLGMDDQVHGLMLQWFEDKWDATLHAFAGNLFEDSRRKREGGSIQAEYLTSETNKLGFSLMQADSKSANAQRFAIHNRLGLPEAHGTSILAELGVRRDKNLAAGTPETTGMYWMVQSVIRLTRGYNLFSAIERYQDELKSSAQERSRWTLGFLVFPIQRTEIRLNMVQYKLYDPALASRDVTQLQGQFHVSW
jgi:hypothetical protein